jgi:cell division protein FtsB
MQTFKSVLLPGVICALILYFSYHALAGEAGLARWTELQVQEKDLKVQLEALKSDRTHLNTHLDRLRDDTMDLDYLEELARTKLSYARADEILVAAR